MKHLTIFILLAGFIDIFLIGCFEWPKIFDITSPCNMKGDVGLYFSEIASKRCKEEGYKFYMSREDPYNISCVDGGFATTGRFVCLEID